MSREKQYVARPSIVPARRVGQDPSTDCPNTSSHQGIKGTVLKGKNLLIRANSFLLEQTPLIDLVSVSNRLRGFSDLELYPSHLLQNYLCLMLGLSLNDRRERKIMMFNFSR